MEHGAGGKEPEDGLCGRPVSEGYGFIYGRGHVRRTEHGRRQRKRVDLQDRYEELKAVVPYPELLELEDAGCEDTVFQNEMKGRGVVPVPEHWRSNSGRMFPRGYAKPRYRISPHVMDTGVPEMRRAVREEEASLGLRAKIKERLYPRLGRSLVNQQTLYNAFFVNGTRPRMTGYGEVFSARPEYFMKRCRPGILSAELMEAVGIDERTPPPWLFRMQKHGMPPSYPDARIPGLNSPIPDGCLYGYQPGGWGEPVVCTEQSAASSEVAEAVCNEENQYTRPVYVEELEERIDPMDRVEDEGVEQSVDEVADRGLDVAEDRGEGHRRKTRKERLLKNIRF